MSQSLGPMSPSPETMSTRPVYHFEQKTVVVTGGARGIGSAIAARFKAAGATVSIWDNSIASDSGAEMLKVDVTDLSDVQRALNKTMEHLGRIDVLVHSAGLAGDTLALEETLPDAWKQIIDVNLIGTYHVCRTVVPVLRAAGSGRVVNIASLAGKEGTPNASAYSSAKAGVIALTKSLAKELAGSGVLVNVIAPAAIDTPLLAQMSASHVQTMIGKSPLGRLGTTEEVAELVLWLSSDACTFNTGAVFDLSGGRATY